MAIALDRQLPDGPEEGPADPQILQLAASAIATPAPPRPIASLHLPEQFARTESSAMLEEDAGYEAERDPGAVATDFDPRLIKASFTHVMADPVAAMEYFFARLFVEHPQIRALFPLAMTQTRTNVFGALAKLIWSLDDLRGSDSQLAVLARHHRKYGVLDKHLEPFFAALVATVEQLNGPGWTPQIERSWHTATAHLVAVMRAAIAADTKRRPAWWVGEIVQHELRTPTVAVLTIRPDRPLRFRAGQFVPVQVPRWPRTWRNYSIANSPRLNGLIDLHVRAVGGMVSGTLVNHCGVGDTVLLGAAQGHLRLPEDPSRNLVFVAGGTGLAPIKALIESVVLAPTPGRRRQITLYFGALRPEELYDMRDLEALQGSYPALSVRPVAQFAQDDFPGQIGLLPDVIARHESYRNADVYVSGPVGLVAETAHALASRVRPGRLHHDSLELLRAANPSPGDLLVS